MRVFNIAEAKDNLSELVDAAMRGEEIVIARRNQPLVTLVPRSRPRVTPGWAKGRVEVLPGFDEPLEDFQEYE